jgi:putative transposase
MLKAYKFRIYPNKTQRELIGKTFGSVRYFWNKQVEIFNSYNKDSNPLLIFPTSTAIRNELSWMKEVSAAAIQQKELDFKTFKKQFFSKDRKKALGHAQFKKKGNNESFRLPYPKFNLNQELGTIRLEKIGQVKITLDRTIPIDAKFMSVTVSMNTSNQLFASVLVEQKIEQLEKTEKSIGIDVGIKEFLVQSDGSIVANPKYFRKNQAKLKGMQRRLNKKKKGSTRRKKAKLKVAKLHQKTANQRDFFLHNVSTSIVKNYDIIGIEDLNVAGMVKNHKLAKSISDASFSKFKLMLEYKADWYGKKVVKVGKFYPSSKTCSSCGAIKQDLTLNDRVYECACCGLSMDRDHNAAINIKNEALRVSNAIRA